jgi:hypothetical protein
MKNKNAILQLTGLASEAYEMHYFETSFQYLESQINGYQDAINRLAASPGFWKWWGKQWELRNDHVLNRFNFTDTLMIPSGLVKKKALQEYYNIHEVSEMNFVINRSIMRSTFQLKCLEAGVDVKQISTNEKEQVHSK